MRLRSLLTFDEYITGTGPWYTEPAFEPVLGTADLLALQACPTHVSGSPTLTVEVETSEEGQFWTSAGSAPISGEAVADGECLVAGFGDFQQPPLGRVRLRVTMGGSTPACRLKLYATLRRFAVSSGQARPGTNFGPNANGAGSEGGPRYPMAGRGRAPGAGGQP